MASRIRSLLATVDPSSVKAIAPAFFSALRSAIDKPFRSDVIHAEGRMVMMPRALAVARISISLSGVSVGGVVLGIVTTVVNPPAAAALHPVSIVSAVSLPGSLKWTCMSIRPAHMTLSVAFTSMGLFLVSGGVADIRSSTI